MPAYICKNWQKISMRWQISLLMSQQNLWRGRSRSISPTTQSFQLMIHLLKVHKTLVLEKTTNSINQVSFTSQFWKQSLIIWSICIIDNTHEDRIKAHEVKKANKLKSWTPQKFQLKPSTNASRGLLSPIERPRIEEDDPRGVKH